MARCNRQSKILELISVMEIETQDELAKELKNANFDITQATISRDIKELGLTKILTSSGKYKYAPIGTVENSMSTKYMIIFRESVISIKSASNIVVIKTLRDMASGICSFIDKLNLVDLMGATYGVDSVMLVFPTEQLACEAVNALNCLLN